MTSQENGPKAQPTTIETGEFYCSRCTSRQAYVLKARQPQPTSWFSKIFGEGDKGRFVQCQNCQSRFPPAVLKVADASADADYLKGIRRVAIQMMAVDGSIDEEEITAIQEMYQQVTGHDLDDASIRREAERVSERSDEDLTEFLQSIAVNMNDSGKELILKTAFWVVGADKVFEEEEAKFIYRIGGALGVSAADVRVLMDRMG